jgi:hypothetical protein
LNAENVRDAWAEVSHPDFSSGWGVATFADASVSLVANSVDAAANAIPLIGTAKTVTEDVAKAGIKAAVGAFTKTTAEDIGKVEGKQIEEQLAKDLGAYKDVGGHHPHSQAAFRGDPNYNANEAFSISQDYMESKGWSHQDMTATQRQLFDELAASGAPNTMKEQTRIAVEALKAGGATEAEARQLVAESLANLRKQGVTQPTRIPWNSPK